MLEHGKIIHRRIGDRYEIRSLLGSGGMADVYLAHDAHLMRDIALKILRFDPALDTQHIEQQKVRLLREARAAARLSHPGIVVIHDLGESEGRPFISMEYIQGCNLREMLRDTLEHGYGLPIGTILNIARQVATALDYAHSQNVIHRDIKPENIMVTPEGICKITDFGIARSYVAGLRTLTPHGKLVCTYHYAAPEYFQGGDASAYGDQFSLGCVLYELLTGRFAFGGDEMHQVWYRITQVTPVPPSDITLDLPESVNPIIFKMLAKTPDKRYRTCCEAVRTLESALAELGEDTVLHLLLDDVSDENGYSLFLPAENETQAVSDKEPDLDRKSGGNLQGTKDIDRKTRQLFINKKPFWWSILAVLLVLGAFIVIFLDRTMLHDSSTPSAPDAIDKSSISLPEIQLDTPMMMTPTPAVLALLPEPTESPVSTTESEEPMALASTPPKTVVPPTADQVMPTQAPTVMPIVVETVTFTPLPTNTASPEPTNTALLEPTQKVTPTPTKTSTPIPAKTSTPIPEPTATATVCVTLTPDAVPEDVESDENHPSSATEAEVEVTPEIVIVDDSKIEVTPTPEPSATSVPESPRKKKKREPWVPF